MPNLYYFVPTLTICWCKPQKHSLLGCHCRLCIFFTRQESFSGPVYNHYTCTSCRRVPQSTCILINV